MQTEEHFQHEVWLLTVNVACQVETFTTKYAFDTKAFKQFRKYAKQVGGLYEVSDTTVTGFHFRNADGTVVLELH